MPEVTPKESKAERIERIKREKHPLDVLIDLKRYAESGEPIDDETVERLKWYGTYLQKPGADGTDNQYFMMRIKLIEGRMSAPMLRLASEISSKYGRNTADFTTRQALQIHWLEAKHLPRIMQKLEEAGMTSAMACGDCPRNAIVCPVNRFDHDRIVDTAPIIEKIEAWLVGNKHVSNLPRKFKYGVSGCRCHCTHPEIQDVSFIAFEDSEGKVRFDLYVGGGLGSKPRPAGRLGWSVEESQILEVLEQISEIYKAYGDRTNRMKARVRHLVENWGVERFKEELASRLSFTPAFSEGFALTPYPERHHFGLIKGLKRGSYSLGCMVPAGRIRAERLLALADLLEKYGADALHATPAQNFIIGGIRKKDVHSLALDLESIGIETRPNAFQARSVACIGSELCIKGVSETKAAYLALTEKLKTRFPKFSESITLSLTGCPNACGHPYLMDIGFMGTKVKKGDETVNGFKLYTGGRLHGEGSVYGSDAGIKLAPNELYPFMEGLIEEYLSDQAQFAGFSEFMTEKFPKSS